MSSGEGPPGDESEDARGPNAYVRLLSGAQLLYESRVVPDSSNPSWGATVRVRITPGSPLTVEIRDAKVPGSAPLFHVTIEAFPADGPFVVSRGPVSLRLAIRRQG